MNKKTQVLILGTYHFDKCGKHLVDIKAGDMADDKKQQEINETVQNLLKFKPNKIAVEFQRKDEKELNEVYSDYCNDKSIVENSVIGYKNEIVQLGFKLGKILNHKKIYPVDYPLSLPDEVFEYAKKNSPKFYKTFMDEINSCSVKENEIMKNASVNDLLKHFNNNERIKKEHSDLYLYLNQIGAGDNYCGSDMMTEWYRRNLYIFANLQDIANPDDKILIIYGAGHRAILQEFLKEYSKFEFVDPMNYL
ncbi:DUF5694 domain-containing protein [Haloimpatiens sp. FM7315]|uniref:DUF5694 domain-containing protein n=1 Tax=Haloimpatiens sp. FM7315 TaxID=3298609 RepID=UPI0035A2E0F6